MEMLFTEIETSTIEQTRLRFSKNRKSETNSIGASADQEEISGWEENRSGTA